MTDLPIVMRESARKSRGRSPGAGTSAIRAKEDKMDRIAELEARLRKEHMTLDQFHALVSLLMVSDPWPLTDGEMFTLIEWADSQAQWRGYDGWIDAYHSIR